MKATAALADAVRRVNRAPAILAGAFVITLITALPLSIVLRESVRANLGNSLAADEMARGVNRQWWDEYSAANGTGIGRTFQPSIVGFAAVIDNVSGLLDFDGIPRTTPILIAGTVYVLVWLFIAGGILDRYARNRPVRAPGFFTACGVYFLRFLRLLPLIALTYYVLFAFVRVHLDDLFDRITANMSVERTAFMWKLAMYGVFLMLLGATNMVFDYAKVRAVIEDRRSMIGAVGASIRFIRSHFRQAAALYALDVLALAAVFAAYSVTAPGAADSGVLLLAGFIVSQLYVLARVWIRLLFLASATSLFQGTLAHVGYVAQPDVPLPDPPIVEHALSLEP